MKKIYILIRKLILLIGIFVYSLIQSVYAQDCTVNAGGNAIICSSTTTLVGSNSGSVIGIPTWTFVSGPVVPTIVSPNSMTTVVNGMTEQGDYVFQLSQGCNDGGTAISNVTITARPRPLDFTAGSDFTTICATDGEVVLDGNIPAGFTGEWHAINIYSLERFNIEDDANSSFSNSTISTPTFSLINKGNHEIDPAYYAILEITSLDGNCTYSDTSIIRFVPNPMIQTPDYVYQCESPDEAAEYPHYFNLNYSPYGPYFATAYPGAAGTILAGTTVDLNVISQPMGGAISFVEIDNDIVLLDGVNVVGTYEFTLTVSNACGTYTTPTIEYIFEGYTPRMLNLQPPGHEEPEQLAFYSYYGSAGEVQCDKAGTTDPINFFVSINNLDPEDLLLEVEQVGIHPPGADPSISILGDGTRDREIVLTAPAGGWSVGTYYFSLYLSSPDGTCGRSHGYFVHVSDQSRPDVFVDDVSVCYPGTGAISAEITLPDVYKGVVNSSYFQDFDGHYDIVVVSKPAGSSTPIFTSTNLRSLESTTTTISNLDKVGDYYFKIMPVGFNLDIGPFIEQEYGCSGASLEHTFVIRVEGQVNSNAGSDQILGMVSSAELVGNDPGIAIGEWAVVSAPAGTTPIFSDIHDPLATVTNLTEPGDYEFSWTIITPFGSCVSSDSVIVSTLGPPLNTSWISFIVRKEKDNAVLEWSINNDGKINGFVIEKSKDAREWINIGYVKNEYTNKEESRYSFIDTKLYDGVNYYRVKLEYDNGDNEYSEVRKIRNEKNDSYNIYPNPTNGQFVISGLNSDVYSIHIFNSIGQIVKVIEPSAGQYEIQIDMKENSNGVYSLLIYKKDGTVFNQKIMKF